jgi:hypothetical protein
MKKNAEHVGFFLYAWEDVPRNSLIQEDAIVCLELKMVLTLERGEKRKY